MSLIFARNKVDVEALAAVNTPESVPTSKVQVKSDKTKSGFRVVTQGGYTPIPHHTLVELTREALDRTGLEIVEEEHALARGGDRYFGGFSLRGDDIQGDDRKIVLGLRNAHDRSFAASVAMGKRIDAYKNTEVESASDLLVELVDAKALPARDIYKTVQEFREPRHDEFKGGSLWTLYNSVTENLKGSDLSKLSQRTMTMQSIFDKASRHKPTIIDAQEIALAN